MKRKLWFTALLLLSILAVSAPSVAIESGAPASQPAKSRPLGERRPPLSPAQNRIELALDPIGQVPEPAAAPVQVEADVNLILDDGSLEDSIGIGGTWEFIFLNRFTPGAGDFAFDLDEIHVYFESGTTQTQVGDDIILVAYENTSGNADPAVGSNWLASFPATVQVLDAWNAYTLSSPVHFDGPGDVLLGVIALEKPGSDPGYFPAALDMTASQQRSWAGWWSDTPPPDPPHLSTIDVWSLVDDIEEPDIYGNWMIRGYGTLSAQTQRVELQPQQQTGRGDPTDTISYDLTLQNLTGQTEAFDIMYSGQAWIVDGPETIGPLANEGQQTFQVEVTIPSEAVCPNCDLVTVMAQAQSNGIYSDTATIETCVGDDWQDESTVDAQATQRPAYVCTDAEGSQGTCFYFGGLDATYTPTNYAQKYDIASGNWIGVPDMPTPVFGAAAGYVNGKVYVAGGHVDTTGIYWPVTGALQIYDVASNIWSAGPDLPFPRGGVVGAVVQGKFYVTGGEDEDGYVYGELHEYDPVSNQWTRKTGIPAPRYFSYGAATATDSHLYVGGDFGGENWFSEYDVDADSWRLLANIPGGAGKRAPVMAYAPDCGGVFLYGGSQGYSSGALDSTWYWHPLGNLWSEYSAAKLNTPTTSAGGGRANGMLWSFAGSRGLGTASPPAHESLAYCCPRRYQTYLPQITKGY